MKQGNTNRRPSVRAWITLALLASCFPAPLLLAQRGEQRPAYPGAHGEYRGGRAPGGSGAHLPQWFAQHQGLSTGQQEEALRSEPGFSRLPQGQQQQLIDRLHRLDLEPPAMRQRIMERNERFMALPPERQQEIRGASEMLGRMSPDRRQAVRQAFRDLRNMPEEQRQGALNSARFQAEYSPQERSVLGNLLVIEP